MRRELDIAPLLAAGAVRLGEPGVATIGRWRPSQVSHRDGSRTFFLSRFGRAGLDPESLAKDPEKGGILEVRLNSADYSPQFVVGWLNSSLGKRAIASVGSGFLGPN